VKERYAELIGNYKKYRIKSLYGNKLKSGKTTAACSFPDAVLLAFEKGYIAFPGEETTYGMAIITEKGIEYLKQNDLI
jgi:hypothetical protein